ncbi:DUF4397 domain-containing protein [Halorussus aquaticus]|uniref:DUF4397 domain-containing protein n=1 Tax=Halorussus aquaticus TaxID=2953748 RepID=A0ABD5PX10_9EURY|nr:DUF4397 domain-containing protein [Halorussus aquaticus]
MLETERNTTRRLATISVAVLVLTGFAGVGMVTVGATDSGATDSGAAQVRVAHLSPDAPAVDVLVDGNVALDGVEYGTISDYLQVPAGEHTVTIRTDENETVVFEGNVSVEAGTMYTVAAIGEVSEETFRPAIFVDDAEETQENASVRLIHASPDAPTVDVTVAGSGAVLYDNVTFGNATDYVEVPAGDYTLEVRPATENNDGEVVGTYNVSLESGTAYSAIASGYLTPDDEPANVPFDLIVTTDGGGETMANETTAEM